MRIMSFFPHLLLTSALVSLLACGGEPKAADADIPVFIDSAPPDGPDGPHL